MMHHIVLLVLIFIKGSLCETTNSCHQNSCDIRLLPTDFPDNTEELENICESSQTYFKCESERLEKCSDVLAQECVQCKDAYERESKYHRFQLEFLNSSCEEGDPIFKVISSNIKCISSAATKMDMKCRGLLRGVHMKALRAEISPFFERASALHGCLIGISDVVCISTKLGYHCGAEVRDAVKEILKNMSIYSFFCPEEASEELEHIYEVLGQLILERLELENTLQERK